MSPRRPPIIRALVACALVAAAVIPAPGAALAAPSSGSLSAQMKAKQAEAARVRKSLEASRADLARKMVEYDRLSVALGDTRRDVGTVTRKLHRLEKRQAAVQSKLRDVVLNRYRTGAFGDLEVLLGASSLNDLIAGIDFLSFVGQRDSQIIDQVKGARTESKRLRAELRKREARIAKLRRAVGTRRAEIITQMVKQQDALDSLKGDIARIVKEQERRAEVARAAAARGQNVPVGGAAWLGAGSLVPGAWAAIDDGSRRYRVPSGLATRYMSMSLGFDWVSSTYGNADNSPPNSTASASSRPFQQDELTCANKSLPFGTLLAVSHGGRRCIVVVSDRGPYISGRSLDLSMGAARELGFSGVGQVHVEIVIPAP